MPNFHKELTEEQNEAVTHLDGPLLVIAGAGTGKTRVITYRYCYLVQEKHILPNNILAVTFTEKASKEMSNRIENILGELNEDFWINTFHAFSSKILRSEGHNIGIKPDFKVLNKLEQAVLFRKIFDELELKILRPINNPYQYFESILAYFNRIKEELIGPKEYENYINNIKNTDNLIEKENEILLLFKVYENTLKANNCIDFSGLTFFTANLLKNNMKISEIYSNKFKYIMVDEYQDTNFAQNEIIKLLAEKHNNIMAVGDDDQSIYKFRGASVANILDFDKTYKNTKKIILTKNFRSSQPVLDLAYQSIQNNNPNRLEHMYNINKKLISQVNFKEENNINLFVFSNNIDESRSIAEKILDLKQKYKINYNKIAILLRSTKNQAENICLALKEKNIPYVISGESGFFQKNIIKNLLAILGFLNNPNEDIYLYRILLSPIFNVDPLLLKEICDICKSEEIRLISLIENTDEKLVNNKEILLFINKIKQLLSWLKEKSLKEDISVFIDNVFKNIDYFKNYLDSNTEEKQLLEIFKNFANEFKEKYQVSKLEDFLFYLDLTMKLYEDISIEENEFNEDTRDKVNIMTVHKAKGLEFDNVFIANLSEQRFPQRFKTKPFEIPEILVKENLPKKEVYLEEERRLFYVAVTRAKKSLFLSYAENYGGVRQKKPSIFLEEINSLPIKKEVFCLNKPKLDNKNKIVNKKEKLYLSYTQIDTYKTCPLKYKYAYIDNVPFKPTLSLAFGNFIHSMLEGIYNDYKKCKSFNNKFLEDLINQKWPENIFINKKQEEEYKNKTIEMLNIYTDKHKCKFHIPLYIEFPFEIDIGNNIVLKGRIDRIDNIDNNIIELIDFKSSFSLPSQREIDRDNQMTIYALAAKKILNLTPELLTVYYVMLDEKFNTKRSDKDIKILESDINETADKIRQFIYQPKKGWVCRFCNFNFICPEMERKY